MRPTTIAWLVLSLAALAACKSPATPPEPPPPTQTKPAAGAERPVSAPSR